MGMSEKFQDIKSFEEIIADLKAIDNGSLVVGVAGNRVKPNEIEVSYSVKNLEISPESNRAVYIPEDYLSPLRKYLERSQDDDAEKLTALIDKGIARLGALRESYAAEGKTIEQAMESSPKPSPQSSLPSSLKPVP